MTQKNIILIDNYDSFTFNIVHYLEQLNANVTVVKNDEVVVSEVENYDVIILSPGAGLPSKAGKMMQVIERYHTQKPIFGICLGMQAIAEFFGGKLYNQAVVKHGVSEWIDVTKTCKLYTGLEKQITVGLYHSWAASLDENEVLFPTSFSKSKVLMSLEHKHYPIAGVQYHPESIMTKNGLEILGNFLKYYH